jgi:hypothetical protein
MSSDRPEVVREWRVCFFPWRRIRRHGTPARHIRANLCLENSALEARPILTECPKKILAGRLGPNALFSIL